MGRLLPSLLVMAACTPLDPLVDTPIVGGSDEVRAAIRAELAAFDEATGFERTRISRVRVKDRKGLGRFDYIDRSITLDDSLDALEVVPVLRHELCHALNKEEKQHKDHPELYQRLGHGLFSSGFAVEAGCTSTQCVQDEVFAAYCQLGPWVAYALSQECSGDPEDGTAILRQMAEDVWTNAEQPLPTFPGAEWASLSLDAPPERVVPTSTVVSSVFFLVWGPLSTSSFAFLDVHTGRMVAPQDPLGGADGVPEGLPLELPNFSTVGTDWGWATGPYLTLVEIELYDQGSVQRTVWSDGERWWLAEDGCEPEIPLFFAEDRVFAAYSDGARIGWAPLEP